MTWGFGAGVVPGAVVFDDAAWYHRTAMRLARGEGYVSAFDAQPTAAWPPGYPAVLAVFYRALGARPETAVVVNAAAGALACWLVWRLGATLGAARAGVVGAALLALFPSSVCFGALVLSESVFACAFAALLAGGAAILGRDGRRAPAWVLWGAGAGLAGLVRAEAIVLVLVPALVVGRRGGAARVLAATALGVVLALAPWTLRNARLFGTVVPTTTSLGRTLWIGHNPDADGGMSETIQRAMRTRMMAAGVALKGPTGELATNRLLLRDAVGFALANPARELGLVPRRIYHLFRGDHVWQSWYQPGTPRWLPSAAGRRLLGRMSDAYFAAVALLAVAGCCSAPVRRHVGWRFVATAVVTWIVIFAAIYGDPRFHQALLPPACLFAGVFATMRRTIRRESSAPTAA